MCDFEIKKSLPDICVTRNYIFDVHLAFLHSGTPLSLSLMLLRHMPFV